MTENEIKSKLEVLKEWVGDISLTRQDMQNVIDEVIKSLEELKQYRAIGTVEGYECAIKSSLGNYNLMKEYKTKVDEFEAIGTIEEFKALKEKSVAKKAKWHPNPCAEDNRIPICPNCNTIMVRTEIFGRTIDEHCVSCGQAIDWSE